MFLNIYVPQIGTLKCIQQILTNLKVEIEKSWNNQ